MLTLVYRKFSVTMCAALLAAVCVSANAAERTLYDARSDHQRIIVTETPAGLRMLRFAWGGTEQSAVRLGDPDHLEFEYTQAMPLALAFVERPERVLIIGLGGGTLPMFFARRVPSSQVDVVELDSAVVTVAKRYFGFSESERLRVHVGDGRRFVDASPAARYDIVILDAYGDTAIPYPLATLEFHRSVLRVLTSRGVVVSNLWTREENPLYRSMLKTHEAAYAATALLDLAGSSSRLVIGSAFTPLPEKAELVGRAKALTERLALRVDLAPIVARGLRPIGGAAALGRVLRDGERR